MVGRVGQRGVGMGWVSCLGGGASATVGGR